MGKTCGEIFIDVKADTEQAVESIKDLTDAMEEFPPNVLIRNCDGCTFNIYPSQTKIFSDEGGEDNGKV